MTSQASSKPTHENLVDFYQSLLGSLSMETDSEGLVSMSFGGQQVPAVCSGKRLVIPTRDALRAGHWDQRIAFHPLAENVYRGESPVLKKLRNLVIFRLSSVLSILITELTDLAADKDNHSKLSPSQSKLLNILKDANADTAKDYGKVLNSTSTTHNRLISIYLKRGGRFKGHEHSRVAVASFPIMEEFNKDDPKDRTVFGVKLRVRDFDGLKNLLEYLLPSINKEEAYSHGTNTLVAPYFNVLLHSYLKIAKDLNKVTRRFKARMDADVYEQILIDTSWEDEVDDLAKYRDLIPTLEGNAGEPNVDGEDATPDGVEPPPGESKPKPKKGKDIYSKWIQEQKAEEERSQQEAPPPSQTPSGVEPPPWETPPQAPTPPPAQPSQPAQGGSGHGLSWSEIQRRRQANLSQPPQPVAPPPQYPQQPQVAPPGFAGQPVQQQVPPPGFPQQQPAWNRPQQPTNTFASHPRNMPQQQWGPQQGNWQQQQQQGWGGQQQPQQGWGGPVYPGGI